MPMAREVGVPDRVDPGVHTVQPSACDPFAHAAAGQAERAQLPECHDVVLSAGALGDRAVKRGAWRNTSRIVPFLTTPLHDRRG